MEVGFHGEYREIAGPHRLVSTEAYEGIPDPDASPLNIVTLDEVDGVTTMTMLVQHTSQEDRDAVLASGMEGGMQVSYDRLEDLVRQAARLRSGAGPPARPSTGAPGTRRHR